MSFNKYFNNIYCINLDKRTDRWEKFLAEIKQINLENVNRFSAIDGNNIINGTNLLNGELGVLLSHYELIKLAKEKNFDNILILEDDVVFTHTASKLDEYMEKIPQNWDFIYFGGNHIYGREPQKINDKVIKLNHTVALQCIAIKNTMYDVILEVLGKKKKQVDAYYADLQKPFNAYGVKPNIAIQREDYSDIQNKIVNYNHFFI
jgi:glycosyl transferase family 25